MFPGHRYHAAFPSASQSSSKVPAMGRSSNTNQKKQSTSSSRQKPVVIDLTQDSPPRKRPAPIDHIPSPQSSKKVKAEPGTAVPKESQEKRLRRFRPAPPQAFFEIYSRATSQRFFVLSRKRTGCPECPEEEVEMTGSTGNIYTVHIGQRPSCTCPHSLKGNQCKHWLWVSPSLQAKLARPHLLTRSGHVARSPCRVQTCIPISAPEY